MSKRRDRRRRPGRRAPFRDPKPIVLIVCEGKETEPQYFRGFIRACHNPRVRIKVSDEHGVPMTLVRTAKELKRAASEQARTERDENLAYDAVWCVFDVDDHPGVNDAKVMARDNDVRVAISNPCFELWLVLHFRPNPGMQSRGRMSELLAEHIGPYSKHVDFSALAPGYDEAVKRAHAMNEAAEEVGEAGRNPSTNVYELTEQIRGIDGQVRLR